MHIYYDGQRLNISSIYTSENIEEVINHLLAMNLETKADVVEFFTYFRTIHPRNYCDLEEFFRQVHKGVYTNQVGRLLSRNKRTKRTIGFIIRILSVHFIRQEKQIFLSDLPVEVMQLLFQNNIKDDINKLFKASIKNDSYRTVSYTHLRAHET